MKTSLPEVIHTYQNHVLDSTRWQYFHPRPDDIIIATAYKSGTTWMQEIVRQLVFLGPTTPQRDATDLDQISPWLDARWFPVEGVIEKLEAQQHRRFIKTHLPLDGLPFFPQVKYIVVGRDARDVGMSLWNHYSEFTDNVMLDMQENPGRVGEPTPSATDIHDFWRNWITRGWFPWESEGYPFWGNLHHTQTWWGYRHLPNLHFVHYHDLKTDLSGEIQRIANFLEIPLTADELSAILPALTLEAMRNQAERLSQGMKFVWKEGAKSFFFKGTNGRWRDVLSVEEQSWYDTKAQQVLPPECRAWLEQGRVAFSSGK